MNHFVRSLSSAGVAAMTAVAVTFAPPAPKPVPVASRPSVVHVASPSMKLTAAVQPLAAASLTDVLGLIVQHYVVPPSATAPVPTPQFPPVVASTSIGSSIKNIYNWVEPWVQYGFELATYAVGWIPYVGWLSGQIMIFYFFGERIVHSIVFNIADWLDGNVSFVQGLINVGIDTVNAFIQLGIDQWNFWLWPLPPLPPIFPGATQAATQELTIAATADPSTADIADSVTPDNALRAAGKEFAPGQLAKEPTGTGTEEAVTKTEETTEPTPKELRQQAREERKLARQTEVPQPQSEVRETSIEKANDATEKADDTNKVTPKKKADRHEPPKAASESTDSGASSPSPGPKTKKDGTPKKDRIPKADGTDNE